MFFEGLGKPWWLAYLITFVVTVLVLNTQFGITQRPAGLIALGVASSVAIAVWFALRKRYSVDTEVSPPRAAAPAAAPQARRRKR